MKIELDVANRMFIVFTPAKLPIYWTAARRAKDSVSTIAFRYGRTWEDLVSNGYELRKIFYHHTQATHRTFNRGIGPARKHEVLVAP